MQVGVGGLIVALLAISLLALRAEKSKDEAKKAERVARTQAVIANRQAAKLALERGTSLCEQGDVGRGMLWMAHSLEHIPGEEEEDDQLQWAIRVKLANWGARSPPLIKSSAMKTGSTPCSSAPMASRS